jgi:hypothetical protein
MNGSWDTCPPSAELTAVLAAVSGPEWRCPSASTDELIGILRRWTAVESWVNAAKLGVLRALLRDDDLPIPGRPRHGDLPDEWTETLTHEIAPALGISVQSADRMLATAWALEARLPGVAGLLADGTLTLPKARLIVETFQVLSEEDAAKAEQIILPELPGKTFTQIQKLAGQAAVTVDPGSAERRRRAAEKYRARVRVFREDAGTAGLSGRDLPTDETLAAYATVCARAAQYKASGAFGDWAMDQYRATAYLDLINGIPADDRIAWAQATGGSGAGPGTGEPLPWPSDDDPGDNGPDCGTPQAGAPDDGSAGDDSDSGKPGPCDSSSDDAHPDDASPDDNGLGDSPRGDDAQQTRPSLPEPPLTGRPVLTDLVIPLVTLLGLADRPGEGHSLGTLDPELCRHLATVALRSPHTTLCVTVTDADGIAIGHCCIDRSSRGNRKRPRTTSPPGPPGPPGAGPPLSCLPASINLTIPATTLNGMLAERTVAPAPTRTRGGWALAPDIPDSAKPPGDTSDPAWRGVWALTLPGGPLLAVGLVAMPTYDCDHAHESHAYQPNDTLRHLVQIRDHTCTFMTCNRLARESDFEHAIPYDKGGKTCACNAGARSRKCHRIKQSPGWNVTQPRPGWHQWTCAARRCCFRMEVKDRRLPAVAAAG